MSSTPGTSLPSLASLPPLERAAAISHHAYVATAQRVGWPLRVPAEWSALDQTSREYNLEAARTWMADRDLFDAWIKAVLEARQEVSSDSR
jgi:hypothetical protein